MPRIMGRRAKDKQLVAQASRRRTVLQIDRVSRREAGEGMWHAVYLLYSYVHVRQFNGCSSQGRQRAEKQV